MNKLLQNQVPLSSLQFPVIENSTLIRVGVQCLLMVSFQIGTDMQRWVCPRFFLCSKAATQAGLGRWGRAKSLSSNGLMFCVLGRNKTSHLEND